MFAMLDRLSRNVMLLLALRDGLAWLVAEDIPETDDLTVGTMALAASA